MSNSPKKRGSSRQGRIVRSMLITSLGTLLVLGLVIWVARQRDTDLDDESEGLTADFRSGPEVEHPPIRFEDVALASGITESPDRGPRTRTLLEDTGSGVAWADIDGDEDFDLYVAGYPIAGHPAAGASGDTNHPGGGRLYRNDAGKFSDITSEAGLLTPDDYGMGAYFADYDKDGDADLFLTQYGPNRLFRNQGDGSFEEVTELAGIAGEAWSTGAAWGDLDRDGDLDLYVANYVNFEASMLEEAKAMSDAAANPFTLNPNSFDPQPNQLYINLGDGSFVESAGLAGVSDEGGRSLAVTFCDLDGDGWLDLYVNNDVSTNRLFRNLGQDVGGPDNVVFDDLSTRTGTADPRGSMGLSVADLGSGEGAEDGLPDLFITHWVAQENALYESLLTEGRRLEYRDRTRARGLGEISIDTVGWGSAFVDFDLDGRQDLTVANGSTLEDPEDPTRLIAEPIFLLWNDGSKFHQIADSAGSTVSEMHDARGLAAADYDADGDIDLAVAINRGRPLILRNDTEHDNHAIRLRLDAPDAMRFGARIQLFRGESTDTRWWGADAGYLGQHAPEMLFGLGQADTADAIEVRWADGSETRVENVPAGPFKIAP